MSKFDSMSDTEVRALRGDYYQARENIQAGIDQNNQAIVEINAELQTRSDAAQERDAAAKSVEQAPKPKRVRPPRKR